MPLVSARASNRATRLVASPKRQERVCLLALLIVPVGGVAGAAVFGAGSSSSPSPVMRRKSISASSSAIPARPRAVVAALRAQFRKCAPRSQSRVALCLIGRLSFGSFAPPLLLLLRCVG